MLDRLLGLLAHFADNLAMYVHPVEITTVQSYLHGLVAGASIGGFTVSREVYVQAAASRGWEFRATGIVWHMREVGLSDAGIIRELIAVQAEAFRLAAGASRP
jgi:hypothetical protein